MSRRYAKRARRSNIEFRLSTKATAHGSQRAINAISGEFGHGDRVRKDARKGLHALVQLYTEINKTGKLTDDQIYEIEAFASGFPGRGFDLDAHAFAGELLRLKGRKDLAEKMFSDLVDTKYRQRTIEFLPYLRLREMGIDPIQLLRERTGAQMDQIRNP